MAWVREGVISATNGSTAITGTGTQFALKGAQRGDNLTIAGADNEIASVNSDTSITLVVPYTGSTASGITAWAITPTQSRAKEMNDAVSELLANIDEITGAFTLVGSNVEMNYPLKLSGAPTDDLHAATKAYADTKLPLTGGALSGPLTLSGDPSASFHASTKQYVDGRSGVTSVAGKTGAVTLAKGDVGLGNVSNTSDAEKPISTATQSALDGKADLASPIFTGIVSGITKAMVGLGNVDNTSDANKPVSTATQTALDGKSNTGHTHSYLPLSGGALTGNLTGTQGVFSALTAFSDSDTVSNSAGIVAGRSATHYINLHGGGSANFITSITTSGNQKNLHIRNSRDGGTTYDELRLGSVFTWNGNAIYHAGNISSSPISTATQTALDAKLSLTGGNLTGDLTIKNNILIQHSTHGYIRTVSGGGNLFLGANGSNHVTITAGGNVGIGATTINDKLTVDGNVRIGAGGDLRISSASAPTDGSKDIVLYNDANDLRIGTGGATFTTLSAGGVLVLGSANAGSVVGSGFLRVRADPAQNGFAICASTENAGGMYAFQCVVNGGHVGGIYCNGTTTTFASSSDVRLKMNIEDATENAGALIDTIGIKKFNWKVNGAHERFGGIAQDIFEVFPEAVSPPMEGDEDGTWGVDWSKFVPMMLKEIQNLRSRLSDLEGNP